MRHLHALGPARRSRGKDDVDQVFGLDADLADSAVSSCAICSQSESRQTTSALCSGIDASRLCWVSSKGTCASSQGQPQPLGGIRRVKRNIGRAGLLNAQQPDHHVERSLDKNPHALARSDAATLKEVGQLVGPLIQSAVGEFLVFKLAGYGIRRAFRLLLRKADAAQH